MAARLKEINPELAVNAINDFITETNIEEFLSDTVSGLPLFDCVIDCVDNEKHKVRCGSSSFDIFLPAKVLCILQILILIPYFEQNL